MTDQGARREGLWLLFLLAVFWGANWPAMKVAVVELAPWTFRVICVYIGAAGLFAIALLRGIPLGLPRGREIVFAGTSILNVAIWQVTSAYGLQVMSAGRAVLVAFTMPLWAAVFGAIFVREKFTARKSLALLLGLAGLGLLALPAGGALVDSLAGLGLMLSAAIAWGAGTVALKAQRFAMSAVTLTAWQLAIAGVPLVAGMVWFEVLGPSGSIVLRGEFTAVGLAGAAYAATVPMIFCHWAWFRTLEILPASVASIGTLAVPVVGVLSSALLLGEALGWAELLAMVCVVAALALALLAPGKT
ncbi:MAG: DMT family transporter [Rhodospirillales bacterium]|nr:DMT family transporter [Rhodospirillales bacterium]